MKIVFNLLFILIVVTARAQTSRDSGVSDFFETYQKRLDSMPGRKFEAFDAYSTAGIRYTTDSLQGKLTLINFWFEACTPCVAEVEALNHLYRHFEGTGNFQFLSFTFDPVPQTKAYIREKRISYPVICLKEEKVRKLNGGFGFPLTAIVDATGGIVYFKPGGTTDPQTAGEEFKKEVYPVIEKHLSGK